MCAVSCPVRLAGRQNYIGRRGPRRDRGSKHCLPRVKDGRKAGRPHPAHPVRRDAGRHAGSFRRTPPTHRRARSSLRNTGRRGRPSGGWHMSDRPSSSRRNAGMRRRRGPDGASPAPGRHACSTRRSGCRERRGAAPRRGSPHRPRRDGNRQAAKSPISCMRFSVDSTRLPSSSRMGVSIMALSSCANLTERSAPSRASGG